MRCDVLGLVRRRFTVLGEVLVHPLVEISMVYLVVTSIAIAILDYTTPLRGDLRGLLYTVDALIVSILLVDLLVRAILSGNPRAYLTRNIYEIPALVPLYVFHLIEAIPSIAGLIRVLRLLRLVRLVLLVTRGSRMARVLVSVARGLQFTTIAGILALTVFTSAFVTYVAEVSGGSSSIRSFWDSLWWALTTVTTVGYGDVVPETQIGRFVGALTMIVGIGVYSAFIGLVAATLTRVAQAREEGSRSLCSKLENLENVSEEELEKLLEDIRRTWESRRFKKVG